MVDKLIIHVDGSRLSVNDVWNIIADEGNVHTELSGMGFTITSDWGVHLVRIYNKLKGSSLQRLEMSRTMEIQT